MPKFYKFYDWILNEPHTLIAGRTGAGKTVIMNGIIVNALSLDCELWLADPKQFELRQYIKCHQVKRYADERESIVKLILDCAREMRRRNEVIKTYGDEDEKIYQGRHLYLIIDELGDVMNHNKKEVFPALLDIVALGRSARVHLIAATQRPSYELIPPRIRDNFTCRIGLKVNNVKASKIIFDSTCCADLPEKKGFAYCLFGNSEITDCINDYDGEPLLCSVPMYSKERIRDAINATKINAA